jgi:hypothetical protein
MNFAQTTKREETVSNMIKTAKLLVQNKYSFLTLFFCHILSIKNYFMIFSIVSAALLEPAR